MASRPFFWAIVLSMSLLGIIASTFVYFYVFSERTHVDLDSSVGSDMTLEDAILFVSPAGGIPREAQALGDIDLSQPNRSFDYNFDETNSTHWWVIGHVGGEVAFTSTRDLNGIDLYAIAPYNIATSLLDWSIPENLDGYVNGSTYSDDWWAATATDHGSHVALDTDSTTLWLFGPSGSSIGTITVRLHVPN